MPQFRLNRSGIFILLAAFLAMHWNAASAKHFHLTEHHEHGGSHHQHHVKIHAHNFITQHTDLIDTSHQANHNFSLSHFFSIDSDSNSSNGQYQYKSSVVAVAYDFQQTLQLKLKNFKPKNVINLIFSHLYRSIIHLRGPPHFL